MCFCLFLLTFLFFTTLISNLLHILFVYLYSAFLKLSNDITFIVKNCIFIFLINILLCHSNTLFTKIHTYFATVTSYRRELLQSQSISRTYSSINRFQNSFTSIAHSFPTSVEVLFPHALGFPLRLPSCCHHAQFLFLV